MVLWKHQHVACSEWSTCSTVSELPLQHEAVHDAPGHIERDEGDDEPVQGRFVVLKWEQTGRHDSEDQCANEKGGRAHAATAQEGLLDETAEIVRPEGRGFRFADLHAKVSQIELAGAREPPNEGQDDEDSQNDGVGIDHGYPFAKLS